MSDLIKKLEAIKASSRRGHEAILQVKIDSDLRDRLYIKLEKDGLTTKDLILSAIEIYMGVGES